MINWLFLLPLVLTTGLWGCGKNGDNNADDGQEPTDDGGTIDDNPRDVTGRFFFDNTDNPVAGFDLVLADWNALTMKTYTTRTDGSVTIELNEFKESGLYSFHLISSDRKIGDLDLSAVNSGLQSAFVYRGGYGFALGDIIIPKDDRGIISVPISGLTAAVGGGFSLSGSTEALRIENFPKPDLVSSFDVMPSLIVSDPRDIYYGFLNVLDTLETERVLIKYNALSFRSVGKNADEVARIFVSREASWQGVAKLLPEDFSPLVSAVFWHTTSLYLTQDGINFSAEVLPGLSLLNRLIFLKVEGKEPPQFEIPRMVTTGYSRPPLLTSISLTGGSPATIDYSDASIENGLSIPFCHTTGDVVGIFSVARDLADAAVDGTVLNQAVLSLDYYSQASGVTTKIDGTNSLSAPYDRDIAEAVDGIYLREWNAGGKSLIRTMTTASSALSLHSLTVPSELLPASFGGKTVTRTRVKVLFKGKNHSGKSGSVFWLKKGC